MIKKIAILTLSLFFSSEYEIKAPFHSDSQVSYIGSHPAHNWTGVSDNFKGGIACNSLDDCIIKIQIPVESFNSGNSSRDSNMLYYVESNKYRYVTFYSNSFSISNNILSVGGSIALTGTIDFHGVKKDIFSNVFIYPDGQFLIGNAEFDIYLTHHKVDRPSLLFVPISDQVTLKCNLYCFIEQFRDKIEK